MRCRWESPDGARCVVLSFATVESLRAEVLEAFFSLPKRGFEVGGLLLGRPGSAPPGEVRIEAYEAVPCEHRYGPGYVLSPDDRIHLLEALQRTRPEGSPQVVGFYRSFTRRDLVLDETERDLMQASLPGQNFTVLLLRPQSASECRAAFLFCEDGQLGTESSYPSFEFDSRELEVGPDLAPTAVEAGPPPLSAPAITEPQAVPVVPPAIPAAIIEPQVRPEPALPAHFFAEPEPEVIGRPEPVMPEMPRFRHIPYSDQAEPAAGGAKRIWLPLLACMILGIGSIGMYQWWKSSRQPRFTDLKLDARQGAGEIRLSWDRAAAEVVVASRGTLGVTDGALRKEIPLTSAEVHAGQFYYKPVSTSLTFQLEVYDSGNRPVADSLRIVNVPPASPPAPDPAASASVPPPPRRSAPEHKGEASRTAVPPAPSAAANSAPAPPVSAAVPATVAAVATPAVVIERVEPAVSEGIRSRIEAPVVVPVEVRISETGKVVGAAWQGGGDSIYRYLGGEAVKAARSWRFSPAKSKDGTPLPSKKRVEFVFNPSR